MMEAGKEQFLVTCSIEINSAANGAVSFNRAVPSSFIFIQQWRKATHKSPIGCILTRKDSLENLAFSGPEEWALISWVY